ncbi:MAG: TRIC cation channel family protein [Oscillospiraceae bacterium]|nr:TRIC cation channel family protein [Oscillospiraceae bacterium]
MYTFIRVIEIIGTIAFALSGVVIGMRKNLDLFGDLILGIVTAVGGGILRDLMIGRVPPSCFRDPIYIIIAICASLVFCLPFISGTLLKSEKLYEWGLFAMDTVGLAIFTIVGIRTGIQVSENFSYLLLVTVGVLTGTGGGVLRDVLAGDTPYIFKKHVYATASLVGAVCYLLLYSCVNEFIALPTAMLVIIIIRTLAAVFKWNLPHPKLPEKITK